MELHAITLLPHWPSHRVTDSLNKDEHTLQHSESLLQSEALQSAFKILQRGQTKQKPLLCHMQTSSASFLGQKRGQTHFHSKKFRSRIGHEIEKGKKKALIKKMK